MSKWLKQLLFRIWGLLLIPLIAPILDKWLEENIFSDSSGITTTESVLISAAPWDRRRGYRGAGSPACCRHRVSARGSPDQRPAADTTRRRISPVCRRAARRAGRLWCLQAQRCLAAAPVASARSQWHARPRVAPSGREASPARAGLARSPCLMPPSARMRERTEVSFSCGENGRRARRFPKKRRTFSPLPAGGARGKWTRFRNFRICGNGSAKNAPLEASADARSG